MAVDKLTPSDFRAEAQRLIASGKMPALEDLLGAVASSREKYKSQIETARKQPESEEKPETNWVEKFQSGIKNK